MYEELKPFTSTETKRLARHRGACTCKWRGEWHDNLEAAKADRDEHLKEHARVGAV